MSEVGVRDWLESRVPPPPAALARILATVVGDARCSIPDIPVLLVERAEQLIAKLSSGRESANELLAADALITYALEAATENAASIEKVAQQMMISIAGIADRNGEAA